MTSDQQPPATSTPERLVALLGHVCPTTSDALWLMSRPFVVGEHLYATNGYLCLRIPTPAGWAEPELDSDGPRIPPVDRQPWHLCAKATAEWIADRVVSREDAEGAGCGRCLICKGTGSGRVSRCKTCAGAGGKECESCGRYDECPYCLGYGWLGTREVECPNCKGRDGVDHTPARIAGRIIGGPLFSFIGHLPRPRHNPAGDPSSLLAFAFDGGEGVVMPLAPAFGQPLPKALQPEAATT